MVDAIGPSELAIWKGIPTAVISDEQNHRGVLDPSIRCLTQTRFAGLAHTIRTISEPNPAAHWAINQISPGDVILIDGRAYPDSAIWGGNMICAAAARGLSALVVDGNVRDGDDLLKSGVAVYARRVQAVGWHWGGVVDEPIECGGIGVSPGDLIVGDRDGVVVVSPEGRHDLLRRCHQRMADDEELQAKVRAGLSTIEILGLPPFPKHRA